MKRPTKRSNVRKHAGAAAAKRAAQRAKADRCDWCCCGECKISRPEFAIWS